MAKRKSSRVQYRLQILEQGGVADSAGVALNGLALEVKRLRRADRLESGKR